MKCLAVFCALLIGASNARSVAHTSAREDKIQTLPGLQTQPNFNQYSGYLHADVDTYFHYWFVESQSNPNQDPLLLWLNGGPGCSSMDGFLNELGPFTLNTDGTVLTENPYSWNTFANVLFLESPACVGFSYNSRGNCSASDDSTSLRNLNSLRHFFEKFPQFKSNDFYVTGESYAGIYVPTLSERIAKEESSINLKGFAVGNGLASYAMNDDSIIFFAYFHGLVGQRYWDSMVHHCCEDNIASRDTCEFTTSSNNFCIREVSKTMDIIFNQGLNMYNLYGDCVSPSLNLNGTNTKMSRQHADRANFFRHFQQLKLTTGPASLGLDPPCTDSSAMSHFLNSAEVKEAIHVKNNIKWEVCNDQVNANYERQYQHMRDQYKFLLSANIRGLVYNGDVDMACNFLGDQWFVESLELKDIEMRRMWHQGGQVGGFVKRFEGLDFMTVRGSGHMVPQDKPGPALHMIKSFVMNTPY